MRRESVPSTRVKSVELIIAVSSPVVNVAVRVPDVGRAGEMINRAELNTMLGMIDCAPKPGHTFRAGIICINVVFILIPRYNAVVPDPLRDMALKRKRFAER